MTLTFDQLRKANLARLPLFKNKKGEMAHSKADGSDWDLSTWSNAVLGELGEAANIIKKIRRGDVTLEEVREDLGREFADVQTYLDILAYQAGVDLGEATIKKWNEVSERIGCNIKIDEFLESNRCTGRTTRQICNAPPNSFYVCHNYVMASEVRVNYLPRLNRNDLTPISLSELDLIQGHDKFVVVDHVCKEFNYIREEDEYVINVNNNFFMSKRIDAFKGYIKAVMNYYSFNYLTVETLNLVKSEIEQYKTSDFNYYVYCNPLNNKNPKELIVDIEIFDTDNNYYTEFKARLHGSVLRLE